MAVKFNKTDKLVLMAVGTYLFGAFLIVIGEVLYLPNTKLLGNIWMLGALIIYAIKLTTDED